jgi:hypothetical protein
MLEERRLCNWCERELPIATREDAIYCSQKCRQTAFRCRRRQETESDNLLPKTMAYADPPYPGKANLYCNEPTYRGEVNHAALIAELMSFKYDGWALSTSSEALQYVLSLCPKEIKVCPWVKPIGVSSKTYGLHNTWEPLIVVPGRSLRPGFRDWLSAQPARHGGTLIGRKPLAFCLFLFQCLGLVRGDTLIDLFPGTGIVTKAWKHINRTDRRKLTG